MSQGSARKQFSDSSHNNAHAYIRVDNTGGAGNQSISGSTATQVAFDNLVSESDADGDFSFDDANDEIDIANAGVYLVVGGVNFAAKADSTRRSCQVRINGSTVKGETIVAGLNDAGASTIIQVTALGDLSAGDTVELWARQDSGGSLNVVASDRTFLAVQKLREA